MTLANTDHGKAGLEHLQLFVAIDLLQSKTDQTFRIVKGVSLNINNNKSFHGKGGNYGCKHLTGKQRALIKAH